MVLFLVNDIHSDVSVRAVWHCCVQSGNQTSCSYNDSPAGVVEANTSSIYILCNYSIHSHKVNCHCELNVWGKTAAVENYYKGKHFGIKWPAITLKDKVGVVLYFIPYFPMKRPKLVRNHQRDSWDWKTDFPTEIEKWFVHCKMDKMDNIFLGIGHVIGGLPCLSSLFKMSFTFLLLHALPIMENYIQIM